MLLIRGASHSSTPEQVMAKNLIIHAHPRPRQSSVIDDMLRTLQALPDTACRSLYALYPDFDIDLATEQRALTDAQLVIWLAPVYWYSVPALLKQWFDHVLQHGWAFGPGAHALRGKTAWWITSTGGDAQAYGPDGHHGRDFEDFVAPIEQVARYCGMKWAPPFIMHAGHHAGEAERTRMRQQLLAGWSALQPGRDRSMQA